MDHRSPILTGRKKKKEDLMKPLKDYSFVRGFNYTQSNVWTDVNFWEEYDHDIVERDLGYAERLRLNSARIFLTYSSYVKNPKQFLSNVKDFVRTAWKHGISTNPIIYHGMRFLPEDLNEKRTDGATLSLPRTLEDKSCWVLGEQYFDDLYETIGNEPGLLFWDISNEPGFRIGNATWYDEEPEYARAWEKTPDLKAVRARQELVWEFIRHFCRYVRKKDPVNAIGIGNTFIYETEPSRTAELVDIIVFHDYSETASRIRRTYDYARALGEKYGKPVINNETGCLCRANPYDAVIRASEEYHFGFYLFELMIGADVWNRVHGICYPDGTVRDPSIVSALFGFYRNREEDLLPTDVNQEGHADRALKMADEVLHKTRNGFSFAPGGDHSRDTEEMLEVCEYIANLLECGQLVPMDVPPTARIAAYRSQENPNADEIKDFLWQLADTLKKACHII